MGARSGLAYSFELQHLFDGCPRPTHKGAGNGVVVVEVLWRPSTIDERDRCAKLDGLQNPWRSTGSRPHLVIFPQISGDLFRELALTEIAKLLVTELTACVVVAEVSSE